MTVCAALNSICACQLKARSRRTYRQPTEGVNGSKALAMQPALWRAEKWTDLYLWSKSRRQSVSLLGLRHLWQPTCSSALDCRLLPQRSSVPALYPPELELFGAKFDPSYNCYEDLEDTIDSNCFLSAKVMYRSYNCCLINTAKYSLHCKEHLLALSFRT